MSDLNQIPNFLRKFESASSDSERRELLKQMPKELQIVMERWQEEWARHLEDELGVQE